MRHLLISATVLGSLLTLASGTARAQFTSTDDLELKTVTLLHWNEPYTAHTFTAGALWVGKSKQTDSESNRVEVYVDNGTRLLGTVNIPYSPSFANPYGPDSVIVTGKVNNGEWHTGYTIITRRGNTLTSKTTDVPTDYMVEYFAGTTQRKYFTENGDARIVVQENGRYRELAAEISGPGQMQLVGNSLFVVERRDTGLGDENIVRIDLTNESHDHTFKDFLRQGITEIRHIPGTNILAANEVLVGRVLFIDETTNTLVSQIDVPVDNRAVETLGHCVLTSSADPQKLSFIDIRDPKNPKLIDQWDLSIGGQPLREPNGLAIDTQAGMIYVRSTYMCPSCSPNTQSSVASVTQKSRTTINACME